MKSVVQFLVLVFFIALSNIVAAGVMQVLLTAVRPTEAFSCIVISVISVTCAIIFLDGVVHLGAKYGYGH
jgi:uncharacterized membrane protein YwaF